MSEGERKIEKPTVGQMIDWLALYDREKKITMRDPDTGWTISVFYAEIVKDAKCNCTLNIGK